MTPPTPDAIKAMRQKFGLSVREFEEALGYNTDGRITQALECGTRNGRPFEMTGPAQTAMGYLNVIAIARETLRHGGYSLAEDVLTEALPERMR